MINCIDCGEHMKNYAHGRCKKCYMKRRNSTDEGKKKHADQMRKWRTDNPERAKAIEDRRRNTKKRKEWKLKYNREYYTEHAEELRQYQRDWRKNNPKQRDDYKRESIARRRALPDILTEHEWQEILVKYNHCCAYCGSSDSKIYEEHWIPAIHGGGRTKENIVPSCHRCNSRKGTKTGDEFISMLNWEKSGYIGIPFEEMQ